MSFVQSSSLVHGLGMMWDLNGFNMQVLMVSSGLFAVLMYANRVSNNVAFKYFEANLDSKTKNWHLAATSSVTLSKHP